MDALPWLCPLGLMLAGLVALAFLSRRRRCPRCGVRAIQGDDDDWGLGLARWRCQACRAEYDRDWNSIDGD